MLSEITERVDTAVHEASHCVTCLALGGKIKSADIIPTSERLGVCNIVRYPPGINGIAATLLSGALGAFEGRRRRGDKLHGASVDLKMLRRNLQPYYAKARKADDPEEMPDGVFDLIRAEGEQLAKKTIGENWAAIRHVAEWLREHGTIRPELVTEILRVHQSRRQKCMA